MDETREDAPDPPPPDVADEDGRVPIFGTWPRIYGAVVVWAVIVMALVWVFSAWTP